MSKNSKITTILVVLVVLCLGLAAFLDHGPTGGSKGKRGSKDLPTLYLHGIHDSDNDMKDLMTVAQRNGGTGRLTININKNGQAKFIGKLGRQDNQPLIKINMAENRASIYQQAIWLNQVLRQLHQKYHYQHYNAVGLTSGAVVFFRVAALNSANHNMPQLKRMVSIGGPFNGILHMDDRINANKIYTSGKPLIMRPANNFYPGYKQLLLDAKKIPTGIQFLNIYGNLNNRTNSDGLVTTNSAKSLKYLVSQKNDNYYQSLEVTGHEASHSELANNQIVQRAANRFLFDSF